MIMKLWYSLGCCGFIWWQWFASSLFAKLAQKSTNATFATYMPKIWHAYVYVMSAFMLFVIYMLFVRGLVYQ